MDKDDVCAQDVGLQRMAGQTSIFLQVAIPSVLLNPSHQKTTGVSRVLGMLIEGHEAVAQRK